MILKNESDDTAITLFLLFVEMLAICTCPIGLCDTSHVNPQLITVKPKTLISAVGVVLAPFTVVRHAYFAKSCACLVFARLAIRVCVLLERQCDLGTCDNENSALAHRFDLTSIVEPKLTHSLSVTHSHTYRSCSQSSEYRTRRDPVDQQGHSPVSLE